MASTSAPALFSKRYWDNHTEVEDALCADGPVHHAVLPNGVGVWVITRYEQARAALADPRLSKDAAPLSDVMRAKQAAAGHGTFMSGMFGPSMLFSDPPEHTRKRKLLMGEFTARRVIALQPRIEQITAELFDALPADDEVDLVAGLAFPLPVTVICELLGIPATDRVSLRSWTADLMEDLPELVEPSSTAMAAYFARLIHDKRSRPGDDLLSALIHTADADRLTHDELIAVAFLLLVAGHETTTNLIGNTVHTLLTDRTSWDAVAADPTLARAAVEEVLRFDSPVRMATHRLSTQPITIDGTTIPAGEIVLVGLGAANRDPRAFPDAQRFDLHRSTSSHVAFGHGIHYCLGASLGRLEAVTAITHLTRRFPRARLVRSARHLERRQSAIMNGLVTLPVILQPF